MRAKPIRTAQTVLGRRVILTMLMSLAVMLSLLAPAQQAARAAVQGAGSISAGTSSSCAIESAKAYCWGDDEYGELGDGKTYLDSTVPVAVDTSGVLAGKI